ncbi:MAG TPA: sulfatase-like hydrolase/transferase [Candidatus Polarisedimenticolaceae bacterium]
MLAAALTLSLAATPAAAPPPPPPSVLLITLDTTRADHLGCYGATFASTPNLDALAKSGVKFEQALSPAPLTLPSHATILTGLAPRRHGVRDNAGFKLKDGIPTLAETFSKHGRRTAAFVASAVLDRSGGLDRGFEVYDDGVRRGPRAAYDWKERPASAVTDAAVAWIGSGEKPFFLWVHYFDPHQPYLAPEPYESRFPDRPYDAEVAFMDAEIGRLLAAARAKSASHLLVVAAGDHGESLGEHGEPTHGVFVYQATQRVPLIVAGHGVGGLRDPSSAATPVGLVDLAPTVLALAGLPAPRDTDGVSLVARMRGGKPAAPPAYEMETFFPAFAYGWSPLRALVVGGNKYIEAPRPELYDLARDPRELKDRSGDRTDEASRLAARLGKRVGDDTPVPESDAPDAAERRRRLEALGYVGGSAGPSGTESIDPKDGVAWLSDLDEGRRELQVGDPAKAAAAAQRLLARNPGNVPALLVLGQARARRGDDAGAGKVFRRATEANPGNALAWFHLGNALSKTGTVDEAMAAYGKALAIAPRDADTYVNALSMLRERKEPARAEVLLSSARALRLEDAEIEVQAGLLALSRGDVAGARKAFERALELNPSDENVRRALERLRSR